MSSLKPSRTLYLDTEMTTGANPQIVQVGIVEADCASLQILRKGSWYVRPKEPFFISPFLTDLTGITLKHIARAHQFDIVRHSLMKFGPSNKMCFAWGNDETDIDIAYKQIDLESPFTFTDLGWQFRNIHMIKHSVGLTTALNAYGLQFEGRQHDALDDAFNLARLHLEMLRRMRECPAMLIPSLSMEAAPPSDGPSPATSTPTA